MAIAKYGLAAVIGAVVGGAVGYLGRCTGST